MTIAFIAATEAGTGAAATSLAINVPGGVNDDDFLLLVGVTADGDDGGFDALSGWNLIVDNIETGGAAPSPPGTSVWWRVASSEPASYTITPTAGSTGICAQMLAFSGVDTTTPIDVTTTTSTGDGTNANPASINLANADSAVVVSATWDSAGGDFTAVPTGYTSPSSLGEIVANGGGNGASLATAYDLTVSDPEDPPAYTSNAEQWFCSTVALRVGATATREQDSFRFYEDGTESGAVAIDAQNTDITRSKEIITQLRVGCQYVGDPDAEAGELQYKETSDPASEWRKVP